MQTWRDWKSNVLKKCAQNKSYANGTGGGPPKVQNLTELEENLLAIIDPEAAGLNDIPQGGFSHVYGRSCETIAQIKRVIYNI